MMANEYCVSVRQPENGLNSQQMDDLFDILLKSGGNDKISV